MRSIWILLRYILLAISIFISHVLILNILPFPFNHINIILILFLWFIIYNGHDRILWLVLPLAFLLELFVSFPFGLTSAALLLTLIMMHWLLVNFFTNRSLYIVFLAGFLGITIFRFSFIIFLLIVNLFNADFTISWPEILTNILYEITLTTGVFFLFYLLTRLFFKRLNPKYISRHHAYAVERFI